MKHFWNLIFGCIQSIYPKRVIAKFYGSILHWAVLCGMCVLCKHLNWLTPFEDHHTCKKSSKGMGMYLKGRMYTLPSNNNKKMDRERNNNLVILKCFLSNSMKHLIWIFILFDLRILMVVFWSLQLHIGIWTFILLFSSLKKAYVLNV